MAAGNSTHHVRIFDNYRRFLTRQDRYRTDWINPICILLLSIMGVFFIYSAQKFVGGNNWIKQIVFMGIGGLVYWIIGLMDYKKLLEYGHYIYLFGIFLLLMVLSPLGEVRDGAQRWIDLGIISLQPSEVAKIATLIMVASVLARSKITTLGDSMRPLLFAAALSFLTFSLIFLQPDLGSGLVIPPMLFALLYASKLSIRFFLVVTGAFMFMLTLVAIDLDGYYNYYKDHDLDFYDNKGAYEEFGILPMHDYQRIRLMTFIAPEAIDPTGTGDSWNYRQSVRAVGTGGLTGKGWCNGDQAQLGYLPRSVAHNDFIFAVLAEEKGFLGGICVIGIYTIMIFNTLRTAGIARDRFGTLLATGVAVIFMIHVFINVGMTIGLMPITGLPLPFLSYGGSFLLSSCVFQGIVQSVHRHRREFA